MAGSSSRLPRRYGLAMSRLDGYVFENDRPAWGDDAVGLVADAVARDALTDLNGSFAAILGGGDSLTLVTDRVGSRPVYYGMGADGWVADFDFWEVVRQVPNPSVDVAAAHQLVAFSYVLGSRTLVAGVNEAPPASRTDLAAAGAQSSRYWPAPRRDGTAKGDRQQDDLGQVIERVADRTAALAASLSSQPLGLALSGGRDSRLVGWMLRSRGIDLACYTTSSLGESDETVERVADVLESPVTMLQPWYESGAVADERMMAALCPTTMYGVANHTLTVAHEGPPEAIHVAGHLGDVPAGSHIDSRSLLAAARGVDRLAGLALAKHLRVSLQTLSSLARPGTYPTITEAVTNNVRTESGVIHGERAFNIEQRQRRFILRDYLASRQRHETFLPLADAEWLDFWATAPTAALIGTAMHESTLADEVFTGRWRGLAEIPANGRPLGSAVRSHGSSAMIEDFLKQARRQVALRAGRGKPIFNHQIDLPTKIDSLDGVFDVSAVRTVWPTLGWDAQRSLDTCVELVSRLDVAAQGR